jgi:hypothetical protein
VRGRSRSVELPDTASKASSPVPGVGPPKGGHVRQLIRTRITEHPALYLPLARRKYPGTRSHLRFARREYWGTSPEVVSSETELVIDGYTRCATTFAVYAFQLAQDRPVRLAHHLHAPAQLIEAAKKGVPVLALIRDPEGAILSQLVREPGLSMRGALEAYARFYSCLMPYRSRMVAGKFEEVTGHFGSVIRQLNHRFGTCFDEFEHTEANLRACFDLVEERPTPIPEWSAVLGGFESGLVTRSDLRRAQERFAHRPETLSWRGVWVPSAERSQLKDRLREQWFQPKLSALRSRAQLAYETFLAGTGGGASS